MSQVLTGILLALLLAAPVVRAETPPLHAAATAPAFRVTALDLPDAPEGGLFLDYLAVDDARHRVWVPAGATGSTDVIDTRTNGMERVPDFATAEVERRGRKVRVGPSAVSIGGAYAYVGNRGDSSVCAVEADTLKKRGCVNLPSMPDGVAHVASTREVWVTAPHDQLLVILDVGEPAAPKVVTTVKLEGEPEGYAVDEAHGLFYTNLEDKNRTLRIDVATRKTTGTWTPDCGERGPRGLTVEPSGRFVMVACSDHVEVLDTTKDGTIASKLDTGGGVDSIAYLESQRTLWVASAATAKLTVARLDESGALRAVATVATAQGARNAVVTADGVAYVADGPAGKILVVRPSGGG